MAEPFDLENMAKSIALAVWHEGLASLERNIAAYGRWCADEALERAAKACEVDWPLGMPAQAIEYRVAALLAESIRGLKSPASAPTERDQNALWRAERELEKS